MRIIKRQAESAEVELDYHEAMGLKNALVAAFHHMDDIDLHSRVGLHRTEARGLLDALAELVSEMKSERSGESPAKAVE